MNLRGLALPLFASALFVLACGGGTDPKTATTTGSARPTCDVIDHACDPHEDKGGLAKECHDLAESRATEEAVCVKRKDECLAVCPKK